MSDDLDVERWRQAAHDEANTAAAERARAEAAEDRVRVLERRLLQVRHALEDYSQHGLIATAAVMEALEDQR